MSPEPAEQIAVDLVWQSFSRSGQWPDRHALVLALDDAGFLLADARAVLDGVSCGPSYDSPSKEQVRLNLRGWAAAEGARKLVRPLGQVACLLAREFIDCPVGCEVIRDGTPWSGFRRLWETDSDWKQISAMVLGGFSFPLNWSSHRGEELFFRPNVEILRYEHAESLDDVLRLSSELRGRTKVGRYPAGKYRDFLRRVFGYAQRSNEWPSALSFAAKERDLGCVADLGRDLSDGGFLQADFGGASHDRIKLTLEAVTTVDDSGVGRDLLLKSVAECRLRWRNKPGINVSAIDLASALGMEASEIQPWLFFLEGSEWKSGSTVGEDGAWTIRPNELILRYRSVDSWDDYLAVANRERESSQYLGGDRQMGAVSQPVSPDLSSAKGHLRRLLRGDLLSAVIEGRLDEFDRVFAADAWLAAMIILGSAMEGVLLDVLTRNAGKAETALPNPRRKLQEAGLGDLVHAAAALKLVNAHVKAMMSGVKELRDLVHPNRATSSTYRPTPQAVRACAVAFENLVVEMDQAIDDGRMAEFEKW